MARKLRDYSYKRFSNPMFEKRHQPSGKALMLRRVVGLVAFFALLGGGAWLLFWSPYLTITDIHVTGNSRVASWEIEDAARQLMKQKLFWVLPKSGVLVLSENELRGILTDRFVFASVDITKRPPHGLDIKVQERVSSILLKMTDGTRAVLDLGGVVLRLYSPSEPDPDSYLLQHEVICDAAATLALHDQPVDAHTVSAVIAASDAMKQVFPAGPTIQEVHLERTGSHTLRLVTSEGWTIYVDASQPLGPQLQNAALVLSQKVGAGRSNLDYIDVRFNEKVFFKLKTG